MSSGAKCADCGTAIPAESPGGFCAKCLLGLGLIQDQNPPGRGRNDERGGAKAECEAEQPRRSDQAFPADCRQTSVGLSASLTEKPRHRIGRYRLLEKIGHGGCGVVYMADQVEPVHRRVTLKVIKLGWTPDKWWPGSKPSVRRSR